MRYQRAFLPMVCHLCSPPANTELPRMPVALRHPAGRPLRPRSDNDSARSQHPSVELDESCRDRHSRGRPRCTRGSPSHRIMHGWLAHIAGPDNAFL
jgi:hypothetical protein